MPLSTSSSTTTPGPQIRICATVTRVQLLRGIEAAEDFIDDPARLGDWPDTTGSRWRGRALCA